MDDVQICGSYTWLQFIGSSKFMSVNMTSMYLLIDFLTWFS
jgi:hypothetical protein